MVSGHLAVKKNRWYAILCLRHPDGRRYDKWITTGLSYPGNKRKAEAMPSGSFWQKQSVHSPDG